MYPFEDGQLAETCQGWINYRWQITLDGFINPYILVSLPCSQVGLSSGLFPLGVPRKTCMLYVLPISYPLIGLSKKKIFCKEQELWTLCNFLRPPVTFSLLDPNILPVPYYWTPTIYVYLWRHETKFCTYMKLQVKYSIPPLCLNWTEWQQAFLEFNLLLISL
jgi:hypothetical protein